MVNSTQIPNFVDTPLDIDLNNHNVPPTVQPFVKWTGGKRRSLDFLLHYFPKECNDYYEPFLGGGAIALTLIDRQVYPYANFFLSDLCSPLIQTWEVIQECPDNLLSVLSVLDNVSNSDRLSFASKQDFYYSNRDYFNKLKKNANIAPANSDWVTLAGLFVWLNKNNFNGLYRENQKDGDYNVPWGKKQRRTPSFNSKNIAHISACLNDGNTVTFENDDYTQIYPCNGDFAYFDPPYYPVDEQSFVGYNAKGFDAEEHERMRDWIVTLTDEGVQVALSNSFCPEILDLYSDKRFTILKTIVNRTNGGKSAAREKINEVLICNY